MSDDLLEDFSDGLATLTMNRPAARNALTPAMTAGLEEAIPRLAADPKVRAVVLTGAEDAFCAGGDVKGFAKGPPGEGLSFSQGVTRLRVSMELSRWLHEMPKPTLAVIPGPAAGGGLSFALACDMRVAVRTAKFTTAFSKIGLSGDFGGSYFLPKLVGAAKARELYFTGDVISADEALELGMLNHVYEPEVFRDEANALARRLASLPTAAIGYMKKNLNAEAHGRLADVLDLEAEHMSQAFLTKDHKTSVEAFVEKRAPKFEGR